MHDMDRVLVVPLHHPPPKGSQQQQHRDTTAAAHTGEQRAEKILKSKKVSRLSKAGRGRVG